MMAARAGSICANQRDRHAPLSCCSLPAWICVTHANAQDFDVPTLRGTSPFIPAPPKYTRWDGFYVGGQIGHSSADDEFCGRDAGARSPISCAPRRWRTNSILPNGACSARPIPPGRATASSSDTIRSGATSSSASTSTTIAAASLPIAPVTPITRVVSAGGNTYIVNVDGAASMRITDYGAARVRGGWVVGNFLPYATVGFAVGRADITRSAQVSGAENPRRLSDRALHRDRCVPFNYSTSEVKNAPSSMAGRPASASTSW